MQLDIAACRSKRNYSWGILLLRLLWTGGKVFFRMSPRNFFGWRTAILRLFGAKVGKHTNIYASARITFPWNLEIGDWSAIGEEALIYNLGKIRIGSQTTVSHRAHICAGTHDYTDPTLPLLRPPIEVGSQVWICAEAFIGPGLKVGDGAVIGAGAVLVKDAESWWVYAGNPARKLKPRILQSLPDRNENTGKTV